jgi:hypothetical protein
MEKCEKLTQQEFVVFAVFFVITVTVWRDYVGRGPGFLLSSYLSLTLPVSIAGVTFLTYVMCLSV